MKRREKAARAAVARMLGHDGALHEAVVEVLVAAVLYDEAGMGEGPELTALAFAANEYARALRAALKE